MYIKLTRVIDSICLASTIGAVYMIHKDIKNFNNEKQWQRIQTYARKVKNKRDEYKNS